MLHVNCNMSLSQCFHIKSQVPSQAAATKHLIL